MVKETLYKLKLILVNNVYRQTTLLKDGESQK